MRSPPTTRTTPHQEFETEERAKARGLFPFGPGPMLGLQSPHRRKMDRNQGYSPSLTPLGKRIPTDSTLFQLKIDSVLLGGLPQFAHGPSLELSDPFFGYAHRDPDLLQGQRFLAASEAESVFNDLPLPLVKSLENSLYLRFALELRRLLLGVGSRGRPRRC